MVDPSPAAARPAVARYDAPANPIFAPSPAAAYLDAGSYHAPDSAITAPRRVDAHFAAADAIMAEHASRRRGAAHAGTLWLAPVDRRVASTAISNALKVSLRHDASCAADTNHGSRESGSHSTPSSCNTCAMAS